MKGPPIGKQTKGPMVPLSSVRARLTAIWLLWSAFIFTIVIIQSVAQKYAVPTGDDTQQVDAQKAIDLTADMWKWLLPNLLPTLTTMIVAAAANWNVQGDIAAVRSDFYRLTVWLSVFYLSLLLCLILCQPMANPHDVLGQIKSLQNSNLATGPIQGLVAAALGALFATGRSVRGKSDGDFEPATSSMDDTNGGNTAEITSEPENLEDSNARGQNRQVSHEAGPE